jgi:hypothetical protein
LRRAYVTAQSKYFIAGGIHLDFGEVCEDIQAILKMPEHSGKHPVWVRTAGMSAIKDLEFLTIHSLGS